MHQIVIVRNPANRKNLQRVLQGNNEILINDYVSTGLEERPWVSAKFVSSLGVRRGRVFSKGDRNPEITTGNKKHYRWSSND